MARVKLQRSKNEIKRAGKLLRAHHSGDRRLSFGELLEAHAALHEWRACHSYPLQKATMGLRSRVRTEGCQDPRISQRLKRRPTIIDKLVRQPRMQLTTMQDIAGCRAVLESIDEVERVAHRWHRTGRGRVEREYDYIDQPQPTGYRAIHLVVQYDGYPVEVQLRTKNQHAWGVGVESVGSALGYDLKSGEGPDQVLELFRHFGDLLAVVDGNAEFSYETFARTMTLARQVPPRVLTMLGLEIRADRLLFHPPRFDER